MLSTNLIDVYISLFLFLNRKMDDKNEDPSGAPVIHGRGPRSL